MKQYMRGKYCEYYWSVRKEEKGFVWEIRSDWRKGAEVLQSSKDNDDDDDKYFETAQTAMQDAYEAIQEYYS